VAAQKPLVVRSDGYASDLKLGVTVQFNAGRADSASVNCPPGTAPDATHRQVGDLWAKADGYYCRSSVRNIGPFIDATYLGTALPRMTMTVQATCPPSAVCFVVDVSDTIVSGYLSELQLALTNVLNQIDATVGPGVIDLCVIAFNTATTSITKRAASSADIAAIITWVGGLSLAGTPNADASAGFTTAKTFFDATSAAITDRRIIFLWQGIPDTTNTPANYATYAAAAQTALNAISPVPDCYVINVELTDTTWAAYFDNTPGDGIPIAPTAADMTSYMEQATTTSLTVPAGPGYLYHATGGAIVTPADALTADPTSGNYRPCNCWISADVASGADVLIYMPGQFVPTSGLDAGATYWLASGGDVTATAPSTAGNLDQILGWADETGDNLFFAPQRGIGE
jgi:hypothetical protein